MCCVLDSTGVSKIFAPEIVKPDYSVFALGTSARKQFEVKNMQDTKEMEERIRRIETWTYRSKTHEMR
jgi:hypothetical protein